MYGVLELHPECCRRKSRFDKSDDRGTYNEQCRQPDRNFPKVYRSTRLQRETEYPDLRVDGAPPFRRHCRVCGQRADPTSFRKASYAAKSTQRRQTPNGGLWKYPFERENHVTSPENVGKPVCFVMLKGDYY